jgi:8-oxo-dGTP pyrophosphatase MutT (NUDIX family)
MNSYNVIKILEARLKKQLPGEKAHKKMWSDLRVPELLKMPPNAQTRTSGVLLLLFPVNSELFSALIQRPDGKSVHSGQISFPGGKSERTDHSVIDTALREAHEEIGIDPSQVKIIGNISTLYIPPSNYIIHPVIGYTSTQPVYTIQPSEVKKVIEYPVSMLLDASRLKRKAFHVREDITFNAPYFDINGNVVWGATAMILSEFAEILKEPELLPFFEKQNF